MKMLLTLALYRLIIGVVLEQINCTRTKNKQPLEKLHKKNKHYSQVLVFYISYYQYVTKKLDDLSSFFVGGAAGYCPRVRLVTYRPSTHIVLF